MPRRSNHANFYASPIWITESGGAFDPPHRRSDPRRRNCPHRAAPDGPDCVGDHDRSPRRDHGGCRFRQLRSKSSHQKVPRPHFVETGGSRTSFGPASSWPNPVDENVLFEVLCPSDSAGSGRQPRRRRHTAASKGSRGVVYFPRPGRTVPKAPFRDRSFTSRTAALLPCLVRASPSLDTFIHARPPFPGSTGATRFFVDPEVSTRPTGSMPMPCRPNHCEAKPTNRRTRADQFRASDEQWAGPPLFL